METNPTSKNETGEFTPEELAKMDSRDVIALLRRRSGDSNFYWRVREAILNRGADEIERLHAALERYGRHAHPNCHDLTLKQDGSFGPRNGCLCGLDAALNGRSAPETKARLSECPACIAGREHDGPCQSAAQSRPETKWKCGADRSGIGGNMPQDCDWPFCGCDPAASKVLEALKECGIMDNHRRFQFISNNPDVFQGVHAVRFQRMWKNLLTLNTHGRAINREIDAAMAEIYATPSAQETGKDPQCDCDGSGRTVDAQGRTKLCPVHQPPCRALEEKVPAPQNLPMATISAICHEISGTCVHVLKDAPGACTIENCSAVRAYLGSPTLKASVPQVCGKRVENGPGLGVCQNPPGHEGDCDDMPF